MYKRLIILSFIIFAAMAAMAVLGYSAVDKWAQGMQGQRLGEFAEVAEQVRQDIKQRIELFMQAEEARPYTHYQNYYVDETVFAQNSFNNNSAVVQSPLSNSFINEYGKGYFQVLPDKKIVTPFDELISNPDAVGGNEVLYEQVLLNNDYVADNVVPLVIDSDILQADDKRDLYSYNAKENKELEQKVAANSDDFGVNKKAEAVSVKSKSVSKFSGNTAELPIENLKRGSSDISNVARQSRGAVEQNMFYNTDNQAGQRQIGMNRNTQKLDVFGMPVYDQNQRAKDENSDIAQQRNRAAVTDAEKESELTDSLQIQISQSELRDVDIQQTTQIQPQSRADEIVDIPITPFMPTVINGNGADDSIFHGRIYYLRQVEIEGQRIVQGFEFNEDRLVSDIAQSASQFMRPGMSYEASSSVDEGAAYSAILDFGFGELVLNFIELTPGWINSEIHKMQYWYYGIVGLVCVAVSLGTLSLWRGANAQLRLAQKKDDFISAVSHELRTPLTSIRMYSEMLEKDWVKDESKRNSYYTNMRQESERLSRLIENVLDFSRIQKSSKKYSFTVGNFDESVAGVVEMMRPYAAKQGFEIIAEYSGIGDVKFDKDSITQIVVNLIDNAIKYSAEADDKRIYVRTSMKDGYALIEVEDRGLGVPVRERKKIFEEFYRVGAESTRETKGSGLGLALVKRFAMAHNGFVEIANAKPTGALFRVAIAV